MEAVRRRGVLAFQEELLWLVPLAAMVAGVYVLAEIAAFGTGSSAAALVDDYVDKALKALPLVISLIVLHQLIGALLARDAHPTRRLVQFAQGQIASPMLLASKLAPMAMMPVLLAAVGMMKMQMPNIAPFAYDELFARLDAALFLGVQPWELSHRVFGGATATLVIDRLYTFWVFLLSIAIVFFALAAPRAERARFFLSFTVAWILLGVLGAYIGTSAGPCFLHLMGSDAAPAFDGLMTRLTAIDAEISGGDGPGLGAFVWQKVLWNAYSTKTISFSMGISAMPSLHNAIAFLYMLMAFRFGRVAGWTAAAFALATLVGSVHLGWHYAVDGLLAWAAIYAVWRGVNAYLEASGYERAAASIDAVHHRAPA